jgi:hypothetical protein
MKGAEILPKRLRRNIHSLYILSHKKNNFKHKLKNAKTDLIKCICDCAYNIVKKNITLKKKDQDKLLEYMPTLQYLSKKKIPTSTKKKVILNQSGGFLPLLVGPILTILASFISNYLRKYD